MNDNVFFRVDSFLKVNGGMRKHSFDKSGNYFSFSFLCGKEKKDNDNRSYLQKNYLEPKNIVLYAENLYDFFKSDQSFDLLTIEDVLLSVSSFVLIILESMGSACELGAFANNVGGREKLYVIEPEEFKNDDSFINNGPLKLLINNCGSDHVIYQKFVSGIMTPDSSLKSRLEPLGNLVRPYPTIPWVVENKKKLHIPDLSFLLSWIFEYVCHFGLIKDGCVHELLKYLVKPNEVWSEIDISLVSGDKISGKKADMVIETLPKMLQKVGLFEKKKHKNGSCYYVMSPTGSAMCGNLRDKSSSKRSLIFLKDFFDTRSFCKEICKIKLKAIKEGYKLYTNDNY